MQRPAMRWMGGLIAALLLLTGCQGTGAALPSVGPRTLTIGASVEPPTLDPTANDAASVAQVMLYNVYETLVKVDGDGHMKPLLARSWTISQDRLTYTFALDTGAKFSSGREIKSADVAASFQRLMDGKGTATLKKQMSVIDTMDTTNQDALVVKLKQPSNMWLYNIAQTAGMVMDLQGDPNLGTATAGSGPYKLGKWTQGQSIELVKSDAYWGNPGRFDSVTFRYFTDANALNNAMLSGDLDILDNVRAPQAIGQFSDKNRFSVLEGTSNGEVVLGFNHSHQQLANVKVRQAINYAIDRRALMQAIWSGKGTLIGSMVPPTDPWFEDTSKTYTYDTAKAKQLLQEAGVGPIKLRLRVPTVAYATAASTFIQSQLKDVGIEVVIDQLEFPSRWVDQVLIKGDYDMTIVAHVEPRDIVKWADKSYYWHYDNPQFQSLVAAADAGTEAEQTAKLKQAAGLLATDAAADFLFLLPNLVVTKPEIAGVAKNATSLSLDLTTVTARR